MYPQLGQFQHMMQRWSHEGLPYGAQRKLVPYTEIVQNVECSFLEKGLCHFFFNRPNCGKSYNGFKLSQENFGER